MKPFQNTCKLHILETLIHVEINSVRTATVDSGHVQGKGSISINVDQMAVRQVKSHPACQEYFILQRWGDKIVAYLPGCPA